MEILKNMDPTTLGLLLIFLSIFLGIIASKLIKRSNPTKEGSDKENIEKGNPEKENTQYEESVRKYFKGDMSIPEQKRFLEQVQLNPFLEKEFTSLANSGNLEVNNDILDKI